MIKTAMIMAAGLGTRFGHYTELVPKGFVEVGGKPMIIRSIETLLSCGIERIILGTGYKKEAYEALQADFPQIETCFSPRYADTNSMYTLYNTRDVIGDDSFLLLESDLVFERKAILSLLDDEFPDVMLVSSLTKFQDQYYVEYDRNHILTSCSVDKNALEAKGELVGIHKLSNTFAADIWKELHIEGAMIFTQTEVPIAVFVLVLMFITSKTCSRTSRNGPVFQSSPWMI
jgi:choline kinase